MSFARILRSSALMGGAQVVVLAAAFVRTKIVAVLLGASGVGLIGIFTAFSGNISAFAGWGLGTSGVRLIAGAEEGEKAAKVAAVRRMGWTLSWVGLGLGLLSCWPTAWATFPTAQYATEMAVVVFAVPCLIASSAWSAVLQASGKIASLAKVQITGALTGLLLGLPAIYCWGALGVALSILLAAAVPAVVLWRAARSAYPDGDVATAQAADMRQLVKLGGALMVVGWLGQLSAYVIRLAIVRQEGLEAAGYYQAAFAITGSLPGFIFAAMGSDFLPRVAAAKDEAEARVITEDQIVAGLLMGTPLVVVLLTLGDHCVGLLYTDGFREAVPLLSWMAWGVFIRLIAWPWAFWTLGRGSGRAIVFVEGAAALFMTICTLVMLGSSGLIGGAKGFALGQAVYALMLLVFIRKRSGVWPGIGTLRAVLGCAAVGLASQWYAHVMGGGLWHPSALTVTAALLIYLKLSRRT